MSIIRLDAVPSALYKVLYRPSERDGAHTDAVCFIVAVDARQALNLFTEWYPEGFILRVERVHANKVLVGVL